MFGSPTAIAFGTDGWRADMRKEFNDKNVLRVASGIAQYLKKANGSGKVAVGYDTRKNSGYFAELIGGVLEHYGFEVDESDGAVPTPALAYFTTQGCIAGVMVTASHNPTQYNGIKFVTENGAPSPKEVTSQIEALIPRSQDSYNYEKKPVRMKDAYLNALESHIDLSKVVGMHVAVDVMFGTSSGYLAQLLATHGANVDELHNTKGLDIGDPAPEPRQDRLEELKNTIIERSADFGIANDGDADRIAVIDAQGNYYGANQIGLVIADYLYGVKGAKGPLAKSISTTSALERLAQHYGAKLIEGGVGFKNLQGESGRPVIAVEESGGIGFDWWVPNKDGIASAAVLCEAVSVQGKPLTQLMQETSQKYGYGDHLVYMFKKEEKTVTMLESLKKDSARAEFGGRKIVRRSEMDGIKLYLDDGSWVLVRESHTEPLVRVYIESKSKKETQELMGAVNRFFGEELMYKS